MSESEPVDEARIRLNPNRLVAYNLRRARQLRGWTQEQAGKALEPHLGAPWAKQTFSMAESAAREETTRVRQFDAADLAAFSQAFNLPIAWFFMPPRLARVKGQIVGMEAMPFNVDDEPGIEVTDLIDSVIRRDSTVEERLLDACDEQVGYTGLTEALEQRQHDRKRVVALQSGQALASREEKK